MHFYATFDVNLSLIEHRLLRNTYNYKVIPFLHINNIIEEAIIAGVAFKYLTGSKVGACIDYDNVIVIVLVLV